MKINEQDTHTIVTSEYINWNYYKNSTFLITGATGLIGSKIVESILYANKIYNTNITIVALIRNEQKAQNMFKDIKTDKLKFMVQDILKPIETDMIFDFIIHTANGTGSKDFVEKPVETIQTIVDGTKNILNYAKNKQIKSIIYLSSMEVYGQTDFDRIEPLKENDYGYINLAEVRNSYPEGKRLAENMCIAYSKEYNVPAKVARLVQIIGTNVDYNDNRVFVQFARNVAEKKDIILHTTGETVRNYCYITDAVTGFFTILERGDNGEIYNIANSETTCSIKEMAEMLCKKYKDSKLKIELENKMNKFYLPKLKVVLNAEKLKKLNWNANVSLIKMYENLIETFKHYNNNIL